MMQVVRLQARETIIAQFVALQMKTNFFGLSLYKQSYHF